MPPLRLFLHKKSISSVTWEPTPLVQQVYYDEDGRRHRGEAPYLLQKDGKEIQRLHYQHFILRQVLKGNTFAPVHHLLTKGGKVLDVGCGTGRWGHEIATAYPRTRVIGFDLEGIPPGSFTPLNYQFQRGNLLNGLPFGAQQFQYVHQRLLATAIPLNKWSWIIEELRRVTHLSGWLELVEMGNTFHQAGPATKQFLAWWVKIYALQNIDVSKMSHLDSLLIQSGFSHVQTKTITLPVGGWGGRIGNLTAQNILAEWPRMKLLAHSLLGIPPEQFDAILKHLATEWDTYHTSYEVYFACGQR
jgi:ubiquinone/menaquinone biosynthesis C-methylase UbiE